MPQSASSEPGSASNRRWLVDENVAPAVTAFLRGMGEDVLDVNEEDWFGESVRRLREYEAVQREAIAYGLG